MGVDTLSLHHTAVGDEAEKSKRNQRVFGGALTPDVITSKQREALNCA